MATRLAADFEPIPGYRLIERLGRGGFGEVWKAEAPGGMLKAIKFVYGDLDEATEDGKPAEQELKSLHRVKSIRHPYILSLERFDVVEGQLLIVMELADRNLYDRFRECQQQGLPGIPRDELLDYMEETSEALDLMNSTFQLQHLDIKPQNLFLVFNHVKVADFGLAKDMEGMQASLTGGVTPVYAAPETFECKVTRFCDQYSLGIVYQELLTGQRPFNGTTARQLMMQHIHSDPDLTPLPEADRPIVGRALSKKPDKRFPTCSEFIQSLRQAGRPTRAIVATGAADNLPPMARSTPVGSLVGVPSMTPPGQAPLDGGSSPGLSGKYPTIAPAPADRTRLPSLTLQRNLSANTLLANVKPAPPEETGPGCLFPTLVIGLGEMGAVVLQRLRRTIRDRFGTGALPHLRLLFIDTDADTIQSASNSPTRLDPSEVYHAEMNRPSHYNKPREDLPSVSRWLNPNLLFRIPRQPSTTGTRAFGRLAFCDHYRSLMQKIQSELDAIVRPGALEEADKIAQLGLRSSYPRVYVVTSLMGGTGSGMFLDLAYAVKFQLKLMGYKQPEVNSVIFVPKVDKATTKSPGLANAYAALTELYHFTSPNTVYEALFDTKMGAISDRERPFNRCLILPLPKTTDASETRTALGLGAGCIHFETLTPFGRHADNARSSFTKPAGLPSFFQTCGTFRLTWPRRTLLEKLALRLSERVVQMWSSQDTEHLIEPICKLLDDQWVANKFKPEEVAAQIREPCTSSLRLDPNGAFDALLDPMIQKNRERALEASDVCEALDRILKLVGQPEFEGQSHNVGSLGQLIESTCKNTCSESERKLSEMCMAIFETPAYRLPASEEMVRQMAIRCRVVLDSIEPLVPPQQKECAELYLKILAQIGSMESMSRGSRRAGIARDTLGNIRLYARKRLEFLIGRAVVNVYRAVINYGPEYLREVQLCRARLAEVEARLAGAQHSQDKQGYLGPCKVILPIGCINISEAADRLVGNFAIEDLFELDMRLQSQIRKQFTSMGSFCLEKQDQSKVVAEMIVEQARGYLDERLGNWNAAAVFFESVPQEQAAHREIIHAYDEALPELLADRHRPDSQLCVLTVPNDEYGQRFGRLAEETLSDMRLIVGEGTDDIVFHREQLYLAPSDLPQLGALAREAFVQVTHHDQAAPHARGDVNWLQMGRDATM